MMSSPVFKLREFSTYFLIWDSFNSKRRRSERFLRPVIKSISSFSLGFCSLWKLWWTWWTCTGRTVRFLPQPRVWRGHVNEKLLLQIKDRDKPEFFYHWSAFYFTWKILQTGNLSLWPRCWGLEGKIINAPMCPCIKNNENRVANWNECNVSLQPNLGFISIHYHSYYSHYI